MIAANFPPHRDPHRQGPTGIAGAATGSIFIEREESSLAGDLNLRPFGDWSVAFPERRRCNGLNVMLGELLVTTVFCLRQERA